MTTMKTWKKWTYGMGNFANTVAQQVFNNRIQFFYIDVVGLNAALAGVIWFIFGLWNAINDPLMGNVSDRTRTRLGRRIPYILFGAVPLGISFFFLWTPPKDPLWLTAGYFFAMLFIFDTLYTLVIMAYNSLFTELAEDLKERSSLAAVREGLAVIALLLAFILAPILSEDLGFVPMGIVIGAFTAVGYLISVIGAKENPEHMTGESMPMWESLKICLSSRPFRWYILANLAKEYLFVVLPATLPFWRKYVLRITEESQVFGTMMGPGDQEAILLAVPFLLTVPLLMIWNRLTPRIGVRRAWLYSFVLFVPGLLVIMLANDFYTGLLGTTLIAPGLAGFMMLPIVMLTEVIDEDAIRVGERREGIFFGINGGIVKLAFSFQGILYSVVFTISGYVAGAEVQPDSAVWGIRLMMGASPLIVCLLGALALRYYPIRFKGRETASAVA
jgi:GPH family glycoside/pentoside/hexuronide:cation symporter